MKKLIYLAIILLGVGVMSSCNKESYRLDGTTWCCTVSSEVLGEVYLYLEFSGNTVRKWSTSPTSLSCSGTYSVSGNKVTFHDLKTQLNENAKDTYVIYESATVRETTMTVFYRISIKNDLAYSEDQYIFTKQ